MNGVERSNDGVNLKKCPFCDGEEITMGAFSISADCYIMCKTCGASIEKEVAWNGMTQEQHDEECKKILAEAWNNRKPLERVIKHLEKEGKFADEEKERCAKESIFQFDRAVGYSNGIFNAIEFIKGEME